MPGCFSGLKTVFRSSSSSAPAGKKDSDARTLKVQTQNATSAEVAPVRDHHLDSPELYLHHPPPYSAQTDLLNEEPYRSEVLQTIVETLDDLSDELTSLSLDIHDHPELGFKEKHAHDTLTAFMASHGFTVERHFAGLDTAWRAEFVQGSGGRVLGVNSEMDALPGIGHACGHNLIAAGGVGVAVAAKAAMQKHGINGKVVLLGTPAEEGGGGKVILIERGAYKDMDLCVMSHPTGGDINTAALGSALALQAISVEYFGHTAHAAAAPWEGTNALDAAFLAYSGISVLRQQIKPDHRVHGIVEGKDWAPNIIPDYARMRWYVRAPTWPEVEVLGERVKACFKAAALSTGCRYEIKEERPHFDLIQNEVLGRQFSAAAKQVKLDVVPPVSGGSTDFGNVTYELPSLHPRYSIPTEPSGGNHTPAFTASAGTKEAHAAMLKTIKALAFTGVRALDDDKFYNQVKESFEQKKYSVMQTKGNAV